MAIMLENGKVIGRQLVALSGAALIARRAVFFRNSDTQNVKETK